MTVSANDSPITRRRRAHKKSRNGCAGCKLRRIKCDEGKPECCKCKTFGLDCSYAKKAANLRFTGEAAFSLDEPVALNDEAHESHEPVSFLDVKPWIPASDYTSAAEIILDRKRSLYALESGNIPPAGLFDRGPRDGNEDGRSSLAYTDSTLSDVASIYAIRRDELSLLHQFRSRTVMTMPKKHNTALYHQEVFQLAIMNPYLKHIIVALTLMHDRHLNGRVDISEMATLHWYRGTAMFKDALINTRTSAEKDALWASAALLSAIQFASIEARTPEEAWPLKPYCPTDLDWLKMSDGKKAIFKIANPLREDSAFRKFNFTHQKMFRPIVHTNNDLINVTRDFTELFGIGPYSTGGHNPYHSPALALTRLLGVECDSMTAIEFFAFIGHLNVEMKLLLERKDPKALLLVACWYAKVYHVQWWIAKRGFLEGRAICMYLDQYHADDEKIQRLLDWPKAAFGLKYASNSEQSYEAWCPKSEAVLCVL